MKSNWISLIYFFNGSITTCTSFSYFDQITRKKYGKVNFFLKDYFLSARWVFLSLHLFIDFEICTYPFKGFSDISYFSDRSETDSLFILFLQNFFAEYLTFSIMANFFFLLSALLVAKRTRGWLALRGMWG